MGKLFFAASLAVLDGLEFAADCAPAIAEKAADAAAIEVSPKKGLWFMTAYHHEREVRCAHVRIVPAQSDNKIRAWTQFQPKCAS